MPEALDLVEKVRDGGRGGGKEGGRWSLTLPLFSFRGRREGRREGGKEGGKEGRFKLTLASFYFCLT